jgi:hypothetical protein
MGLSFTYDGQIVTFHLVGDYSAAALRELVAHALHEDACPPNPVLLFDLRESLAIAQRSASDIQDVARFLAAIDRQPNLRVAMVVSTDLAFGLMRMGSVFAAQAGAVPGVFRDIEPARAWLLSPEAMPQTY